MCAVACDKEHPIANDNIPVVIKSDFSARYPMADISAFRKYSEFISSGELWQIDYTDGGENQVSTWYEANGTWKMTHTKLKDIDDLSNEAKRTFMSSMYGSAQIQEIYKTEREGIAGTLYTLFFEFPTKISRDVVHYVFLNDDGIVPLKIYMVSQQP